MLALRQALSLNNTKNPKWLPSDDASLVAWYRKGTGISFDGSAVTQWADSSSNNHDMAQANASEQPTYSNGVITFDGSDNLQSSSQISLTGDYTIAFLFKPTGTVDKYAVLGDNTTAGHFLKLFDDNTIYVKSGGSVKAINLTGSNLFTNGGYLVLTRNSSKFVLSWNGVVQAQPTAVAGTQLIDTIGGRFVDTEDYIGGITEVIIFSTENSSLTENINKRLAVL